MIWERYWSSLVLTNQELCHVRRTLTLMPVPWNTVLCSILQSRKQSSTLKLFDTSEQDSWLLRRFGAWWAHSKCNWAKSDPAGAVKSLLQSSDNVIIITSRISGIDVGWLTEHEHCLYTRTNSFNSRFGGFEGFTAVWVVNYPHTSWIC